MTEDKNRSGVIEIDFLYLDLSQCERCNGTGQAVDQAIEAARPALKALGYSITLRRLHITSIEQAQAERFTLSPTLRVNGRDIQPAGFKSRCLECGDLCNCSDGIDCREWEWRGVRSLKPPVAMIVNHLVAAATGPVTAEAPPALAATAEKSPDMIERFFSAEQAEAKQCCPPACCQ